VGQGKPKPLEGLLRGTRDGSVLDWLGLGRTTLAPSSCRVWWEVVLAEEARAVVGEGMVGLPARLARVAAPPASRAAAPPRAASKSVDCQWCVHFHACCRACGASTADGDFFRLVVCLL